DAADPVAQIPTDEAADHGARGLREAFGRDGGEGVAGVQGVGDGEGLGANSLEDQEEREPAEVHHDPLNGDRHGDEAQQAGRLAPEPAELEEPISPRIETPPDVYGEEAGG